jgi:hypothetical protein
MEKISSTVFIFLLHQSIYIRAPLQAEGFSNTAKGARKRRAAHISR